MDKVFKSVHARATVRRKDANATKITFYVTLLVMDIKVVKTTKNNFYLYSKKILGKKNYFIIYYNNY